MLCLVDDEDYEFLSSMKWFGYRSTKGHTYYAATTKKKPRLLMHRLITNAPDSMDVDHINGFGLDNRRSNLRVCTHQENLSNRTRTFGRSKFKGVSWHRHSSSWRAQIQVHGKRLCLGYFKTEEAAAVAYDEAAIRYLGAFANPNFPERKS